ncbi:MAG: hypothetical protein JWP44_956 [Mucilaginibacter sp.]|nr:hypothetical protein [Mucilaginibacter sp.]
MRKVFYLLIFNLIISSTLFAQQAIRANRAIQYIGENVTIIDSISTLIIHKDTIAEIILGQKNTKSLLHVLLVFKSNYELNKGLLPLINSSIVVATGKVCLVSGNPTIVLSDQNKLLFISKNFSPNAQMIAQLAITSK